MSYRSTECTSFVLHLCCNFDNENPGWHQNTQVSTDNNIWTVPILQSFVFISAHFKSDIYFFVVVAGVLLDNDAELFIKTIFNIRIIQNLIKK